MARSGRRPGAPPTRAEILRSARAAFSAHGFHGATIRTIAAGAGVDPALVHHYFGTKEELFAACLDLPFNPAEVARGMVAGGLDGFGRRLVREAVGLWDGMPDHSPFLAALRSLAAGDTVAAMLREFLTERVVGTLADALPGPDPELRATLIVSQLFGLIMARYVLRIPALAEADLDMLADAYGPTLQRYATGVLADG